MGVNTAEENNNDSDKKAGALAPIEKKEAKTESASRERQSPKSTAPPPPKEKKSSGNGLIWFFIILILLLLAAAAAGAYWYTENKLPDNTALIEQQNTQQERLTRLNNENATLQKRLAELESSKQALASSVSDMMDKTESLRQQTESAMARLKEMNGRRPSDWLVAEADYLVRMAGRKLWLERDIRTAIMLLTNADQRLKELSDPSVLPVRALIAEDIQALQSVNPVSRTSVALALSGMLNQVKRLPLDTFIKPKDASNNDKALSGSTEDWLSNLKKVWRSIVDEFITVKTISKPVEPVMSQQEQWLSREQLKLQLMQAQSAALDSQQTLYEQSLNNALTLLNDKFSADSSEVTGFVQGLENLKETNVSKDIPTELASQRPLQHLLEQRVEKVFGQGASVL